MQELRYTLVSDGSSDSRLLPILTWTLRECGVAIAIQPTWADLRRLRTPPTRLAQKIAQAASLYPCELLFVHRDAETSAIVERKREIESAIEELSPRVAPKHICVVPVRMTEAWLLFDESAIRRAAGNRNGQTRLDLPRLSQIEAIPDPKSLLHNLLLSASELRGRRLNQFSVSRHAIRVAEFIDDFSPLRNLAAFAELEDDLKRVVRNTDWVLLGSE